MNDTVRVLNDAGIAKFYDYLVSLRSGTPSPYPSWILTHDATSEPFNPTTSIERMPAGKTFTDRYEFGVYLCGRFSTTSEATISMDYRLWNWLALYYFRELCPDDDVWVNEAYILDKMFKFQEYYRHFVRAPWAAVCKHGDISRVMLIPARPNRSSPLSVRGELFEQLASRQRIAGTLSIVAAAYRMYYDETNGGPKKDSGGSAGGSPRRLAKVLGQLVLTYDLAACSPDQIVGLLPKEFEPWKKNPPQRP